MSRSTPRLLTAALAAAERGWPVFPLHPYTKRPAIPGWPRHATCDPDHLTVWWNRAPYNIGIACGPAGLLVVDLDEPTAATGPAPAQWAAEDVRTGRDVLAVLARRAGQPDPADTYTVATPQGEHRYYTVPTGHPGARSTAGTLGWLTDTRAAGGYVIAAGSVRWINHRRRYYRHVHHTPGPSPAPQWLLNLLTPPPSPPAGRPPARLTAYAAAATHDEVRQVRAARPGTRNSTLFTAAFRLGQLAASGLLTTDTIVTALTEASSHHIGTHDFTAGEACTAINNGLRYGLRRPRHPSNPPPP